MSARAHVENLPLLKTKLHIPPVRVGLVPRPHLIERLNAGTLPGHKLILLSAPAGFGKTTLLSEWVADCSQADREIPVVWVSLEEEDNDLTRFLGYLVGALQTIEQTIGGVLGLLQSPHSPPIESILATLINEMADLPDDLILVFDDYHVIDSQEIDQALTFLLDHLPANVRLAISGRTDPSLSLSRLRARGQMIELRVTDLRFTVEEIAAFLDNVTGLKLGTAEISALQERTEGWIAGLQLAALSMQGLENSDDITDFVDNLSGSNRYILDYLTDEVLQRQTEDVQTFLLQTSILDRLTGPLCDAVRFDGAKSPKSPDGTARLRSSHEILETLARANLFITPLDAEWRWYRYHHLFADLLRQRLRRTQADRVHVLHRRASEWYEQNGWVDDAVKHALAAQDHARAARLIEELADVLWERGEPTTLLRWLVELPDEQVSSRPSLCNFSAWALYINGQNEAAEHWLFVGERALDMATGGLTTGSPEKPVLQPRLDVSEQRGRAAAIRASIALRRGDAAGVFRFARQALLTLPKASVIWRCIAAMALGMAQELSGDTVAASQSLSEAVAMSKASDNIYLILSTSLHLGINLISRGQLRAVYDICQELLQLAASKRVLHTEMAGCLYDELGFVLCEWNDLDAAKRNLEIGSRLSREGYDVGVLGWSCLSGLKARFAQGDLAGAHEIVRKMEELERASDVPPWLTCPKEAWKAKLWLAQGDLDAAGQWVRDRGLEVDGELVYLREGENIVFARILLAQGRIAAALGLLERLRGETEAGGRIASSIEISILQALAHRERGNTNQALEALEHALSLARPEGYVCVFVDEGPRMARLLRVAASRGIAPDYVVKLLAAFEPKDAQGEPIPGRPAIEAPPTESPLVEPLTEREREILRLFRTELSGPEIADELVVALSTVRYHTKNIYGKLGVHHRRAAVRRAEELHLL